MRILLATIFFLISSVSFASEKIESFKFIGLERVEKETILSYLNLKKGDIAKQSKIENSINNLYKTKLFSNVSVKLNNGILTIKVKENPIVNNIYLDGNRRIEDPKILEGLILKPRSLFTKSKVNQDVNHIIQIYAKQGRYGASVIPKLITKENNRIDIVYEIDEGPKTPIKKVIFVGNSNVKDRSLKSVIVSKEEGLFSFLTGSGTYDPDALEYDKELLKKYYASIGYANTKITSAYAEFTKKKDAAYLTYIIEEGNVYKFGDSKINSHIKNINTNQLQKLIKTKRGDKFDGDKVEDTIDELTNALNDLGYAFVNISSKSDIVKNKKIINLTYEIFETEKVYIGKINIKGNVRTHDHVIRREFRLDEGDAFNATKMKRTNQRLQNLDYFETINVEPNQSQTDPSIVNIDVDVKEKSTSNIKLSAGYSSVDGFIGGAGISEINLFGTGREASLNLQKAAKKIDVNFGLYDSYFLNSKYAAGFNIDFTTAEKRDYFPYSKKTQSVSLQSGYAINEFLTHNIQYTISNNEIFDISDNASRFIKEQSGKRTTSKIAHYLKYDKRDGMFKTSSGYYINFGQEFAGLGGDAKYVKHTLEGKYYIPLHKDEVILKFFAGTGHIKSFASNDKLTINERFFLGGDSLRGFEFGGIGPRDSETKNNKKFGDTLGGDFYYSFGSELNFPLGLPKEYDIYGLAFVEAGSLTNLKLPQDEKSKIFNNKKLRASAGFGVVWLTKAGIINLTWGFPFMKEKHDIKKKFMLNFTTSF